MNRLVSLLVFICLTSFTYSYAGGSGQGTAVHTIVIDPGHGGLDPGAIGPGGHHESDLALAVSLKFGEMVKKAFPDIKIIYTRTTDKFVSLADRADMANKAKADLFICIHLNSSTNHDAYGTATYVLGLHRTDDNLEVAKRENSVIELEGDRDKNYEFDPNSPEGHIIMSMKQNAFLDQSILIASKIEEQLAMLSKRKSHGVKQAGFWVLYKTAMPSVLAEVGFISNPTEEQYLASDQGQENIATSIFKAFRAYKFEIQGIKDTAPAVAPAIAEKKTEPQVRDTQLIVQNTPPVAENSQLSQPTPQKQTAPPVEKQPDAIAVTPPAPKTVAHVDTTASTIKPNTQASTPVPVPQSTPPSKDIAPQETANPAPPPSAVTMVVSTPDTPKAKPVVKPIDKPTASVTPVKSKETPKPKETAPVVQSHTLQVVPGDQVYFTVQLLAAKHQPGNYNDLVNTFGLIDREDIGEGVVRYMAGEFSHFSEAKNALTVAHDKGIKDAFIVGYVNKKRLDGRGTYQLGLKYP